MADTSTRTPMQRRSGRRGQPTLSHGAAARAAPSVAVEITTGASLTAIPNKVDHVVRRSPRKPPDH